MTPEKYFVRPLSGFFYSLVMRFDKLLLINSLRWLLIAYLLSHSAVLIMYSENMLDQLTQPHCPPGLWHTGLNWRHCAYPPISIAKYTSMYLAYSISSLLVFLLIAPKPKLVAGRALLFVLMCMPAALLLISVLRGHFSWTLSFILLGTVFLYMLFIFAARLSHSLSPKLDALKRAP